VLLRLSLSQAQWLVAGGQQPRLWNVPMTSVFEVVRFRNVKMCSTPVGYKVRVRAGIEVLQKFIRYTAECDTQLLRGVTEYCTFVNEVHY